MMTITPYQKDVLIALNNGATLCTTEGKNFTCWLQVGRDRCRKVRKDTVDILFNKKCITSVDDNRLRHFVYTITPKGKVLATTTD